MLVTCWWARRNWHRALCFFFFMVKFAHANIPLPGNQRFVVGWAWWIHTFAHRNREFEFLFLSIEDNTIFAQMFSKVIVCCWSWLICISQTGWTAEFFWNLDSFPTSTHFVHLALQHVFIWRRRVIMCVRKHQFLSTVAEPCSSFAE